MACVAALALPLSVFPLFRDEVLLLRPLACAAALTAGLVLLRLIVSRDFHHAMNAARVALNPRGLFVGPRLRLNDPDWGWRGRKLGTGLIVPLRTVLLVEWVLAILLAGVISRWLVILLFFGFGLTILLTQSQLRSHFPRPQ